MSTEKHQLSDIFSANLDSQMRERKITQVKLANAVGVSQSAVSGWLNGALPGAGELNGIAKALHTTPDKLLGWESASREVRQITGMAEVLADALAERPEDEQRTFDEFIELVSQVRKDASALAASLNRLEDKASYLIVKKEFERQKTSSKAKSDAEKTALKISESLKQKTS